MKGRMRGIRCISSAAGIAGALLLGALAGCDDGHGLVPATGTVTLDEQPVAGASVLFLPIDKGMAAAAETDAGGRFEMQTANRLGAGVGNYKVSINKSTTVVKSVPGAMMPLYERAYELPPRYANPDTSGLTATVSANGEVNEFTFDLKSK